jgi:ABC-type thiamine transport system substrate-binding protein
VFRRFAVVARRPLELPPAEIDANRDRWIREWTGTVLR